MTENYLMKCFKNTHITLKFYTYFCQTSISQLILGYGSNSKLLATQKMVHLLLIYCLLQFSYNVFTDFIRGMVNHGKNKLLQRNRLF